MRHLNQMLAEEVGTPDSASANELLATFKAELDEHVEVKTTKWNYDFSRDAPRTGEWIWSAPPVDALLETDSFELAVDDEPLSLDDERLRSHSEPAKSLVSAAHLLSSPQSAASSSNLGASLSLCDLSLEEFESDDLGVGATACCSPGEDDLGLSSSPSL